MAGRVNWSRITNRNRMRRQGVKDIKGKTPVVGQPPRQPRHREQATAAFLAWRAGQTTSSAACEIESNRGKESAVNLKVK
jgi:hypothetical protein